MFCHRLSGYNYNIFLKEHMEALYSLLNQHAIIFDD